MASHIGSVSRRQILGLGGVGAAAVVLGTGVLGGESANAFTGRKADPFTLGVASGDPAPDGFVL